MIQVFSLPARLTLVYVTLYILIPSFFLQKKYTGFIVSFLLLLIIVSVFIQRPIIYYVVQPLYLNSFKSDHFFAITEIMNTVLDVNLAVIIPLGYVFLKSWQKTNQKTIELEQQYLKQNKEEDFIYLKIEKSLQKVFMKDIVYIESQKNYIKLKTTEREIITHKSISSIEELLPKKQFLRVHRSYIVAIKFIDSFSPSKLILKGISIPVGRKYKDEVKIILGYF
ncbi:LytTR family DNA-binding domain-containing protein [uncultured Lutibacter sp.]|uniref:LytR/AlgR family response regulator transcription factor n=1 Tax=uncultured Lutibacter sp. TaxID=437739 RepID=UPI00260571CA|nr:LytTR family DNA-binding domain-containing protein [uncultured Lutibacter sp.]